MALIPILGVVCLAMAQDVGVPGILSVEPAPNATGIEATASLKMRFTGPTLFTYTKGSKLRVVDAETGDPMGPEIEFGPGDEQEGRAEIEIPFARFGLLPGSTYYVEADRGFVRINAEPWIIEAIQKEKWTFSTGGVRPTLTRPDAFAFEERRDVQPGVLVQSAKALISGINVPVPVSVTDGEYSVDGGAFTSAPGAVRRKQALRVRGRSSETSGTETRVKVTVGEAGAEFRIRTAPPDGLPRGFTFAGVLNAAPGGEYVSEEATVSGLGAPATLRITGGEYSLDDGEFTSTAGTVGNGQRLRLRARAPQQFNRSSSAVIRIGDASADFTLRTPLYDPAACIPRDMGLYPSGNRMEFNFPNYDLAEPGETVISACVKLRGIGARPLSVTGERGLISINGGPFSASPGTVKDGDEIRMQVTASLNAGEKVEEVITFDRVASSSFGVRTRNMDRDPQVFQVGPGRDYRELAEVGPLLREGDVVEVDGNATYQAVTFRRPGAPGAPIVIRGITVDGLRPLITGGTHTVHFQESNYMRFENFEVTGGEQTCVRVMGNDVTLRDVWIHGCARHGLLGADFYTGSVTLDRVEVSDSGGQLPRENLKHGVYVATDRDRYPGSRLRIQHSYIHDIRGDAIKSRSERNEIYYNWIDTGSDPQAIYTMELLGYQEYDTDPRIDSDVVGNVLVHRLSYGFRLGGDGTGESRGRVRLVNNTFVQGPKFDQYTPVVRLFQGIDAVLMMNNAFVKLAEAGDQPGMRLIRADEVVWASGREKVTGHNNWIPEGTTVEVGALTGSVTGTGNPGLNSIASADDLDVSVRADDALWRTGTAVSSAPAGYEIDHALTEIRYRPPSIPMAFGQPLPVRFNGASTPNIGAQ